MTKNKIFLWIQTALCVLIAILLASSAVRIFIDGSAYQAAGCRSDADPSSVPSVFCHDRIRPRKGN